MSCSHDGCLACSVSDSGLTGCMCCRGGPGCRGCPADTAQPGGSRAACTAHSSSMSGTLWGCYATRPQAAGCPAATQPQSCRRHGQARSLTSQPGIGACVTMRSCLCGQRAECCAGRLPSLGQHAAMMQARRGGALHGTVDAKPCLQWRCSQLDSLRPPHCRGRCSCPPAVRAPGCAQGALGLHMQVATARLW